MADHTRGNLSLLQFAIRENPIVVSGLGVGEQDWVMKAREELS